MSRHALHYLLAKRAMSKTAGGVFRRAAGWARSHPRTTAAGASGAGLTAAAGGGYIANRSGVRSGKEQAEEERDLLQRGAGRVSDFISPGGPIRTEDGDFRLPFTDRTLSPLAAGAIGVGAAGLGTIAWLRRRRRKAEERRMLRRMGLRR